MYLCKNNLKSEDEITLDYVGGPLGKCLYRDKSEDLDAEEKTM
jgi:hypothetical protein